MSSRSSGPVGVFDSGVGGVSVLAEMLRVLPGERYIYFGDSANAPYGSKDPEEIRSLSLHAAEFLLGLGAKCLVVACNTATSAAITLLRETTSVPVVGMEPAVKPAVEMRRPGVVLVMATPLTLREERFKSLAARFSASAEIAPVSCPGLVELVESGVTDGEPVRAYLEDRLRPLLRQAIAAVVLGCTHYVFIRNEIAAVVGGAVPIVHGNAGTARRLKAVLQRGGLLRVPDLKGGASEMTSALTGAENRITWRTSGDADSFVPLSSALLNKVIGASEGDQ